MMMQILPSPRPLTWNFPTSYEHECQIPQTQPAYNAEKIKVLKRPAMLIVPEYGPTTAAAATVFSAEKTRLQNFEFHDEIEGRDYCLVSKKGSRHSMEDRYNVDIDVSGDPSQALFTVIDGHGGHAAANYVAENLGKNILRELEDLTPVDNEQVVERALCGGFTKTDKDFLSQGVRSGACAASVLLMNGTLHVANVGDCRVVISTRGLAIRLTDDHRPSREDERFRIENSGGFVDNFNGVWRVEGSLAVSRSIGDIQMKKWVISEPEIMKVSLDSESEFIIMASDGLWEKVNEQEAVDVVTKEGMNGIKACKKLIDMSSSRGNRDDITVLLVNLKQFVVSSSANAES